MFCIILLNCTKKFIVTTRQNKLLNKITKISLIVWIICIVGVFSIIGYVVGIRKELFDKAPSVFTFFLLGLIILGCFAFLTALICFSAQIQISMSQKRQNVFSFLIKLFFIMAILPIYLFIYTLKLKRVDQKIKSSPIKLILTKVAALIFIVFVILPIWVGGYTLVGAMAKEVVGYGTETITIAGTGSMYPTFSKGQSKDLKEQAKEIVGSPGMIRYPNGLVIGGKRFFGYQISRDDIVVIENDKIREMGEKMYGKASGWVKRIVGVPGDSLEIREGIVYLNGEQLKEPYTAQPRSTFGETFLGECKKIIVPIDSIFVMGDNRKGSGDSREIGFVEISAINHVLPLKSQVGVLDKAWRDTSKDFDESSKIKLDKDKYLQLLNEKRKEAGVKELKYQPKLEVSAEKRGEIIIKFDDFSFEATQSGYTMSKAMRDANYSNIVWGEAPTQGYYDETELIDNQFQFPNSIKFLTDKTYQEVGIAEVEGEINGCPTQVIVQHFAGYVPPNYKKSDVDGWRSLLNNLKSIQPGWQKVKEWGSAYEKHKTDYDRVNEIISIRISGIQAVVNKMDKNQWLSDAEIAYTYKDEILSKEQESLASKLNSL